MPVSEFEVFFFTFLVNQVQLLNQMKFLYDLKKFNIICHQSQVSEIKINFQKFMMNLLPNLGDPIKLIFACKLNQFLSKANTYLS